MILRHSISLQAGWRLRGGGVAAWCRRFGRPTDMPVGERIVLVVEPSMEAARPGAAASAVIVLNSRPIDELPAARARLPGAASVVRVARDVTDALAARNDLELRVATTGGPVADQPGEHRPLPDAVARVWLEIHCTGGDDDHS